MHTIRDFQRQKLYNFEDDFIIHKAKNKLTLDECAVLIKWALAHYGASPDIMPRIKDGRGTLCARGDADTINLPKWARTVPVVLHEVAHCICRRLDVCDIHGPNFVRVYFDLLDKASFAKANVLTKQAREYGLRVAPSSFIKTLV